MLASPLVALGDAARTRTFWVLFGTFFVCGASTNGLVQTHFVSLCGDFGILPVAAASMLAAIGVFDFAGLSVRAGCRTASTAGHFCSGTTGCAAFL